jgi:hypothetical protein
VDVIVVNPVPDKTEAEPSAPGAPVAPPAPTVIEYVLRIDNVVVPVK